MKLALVLFGVWVLLSGIIEPLLLGLGLASSLAVVWITVRADRRDGEPVPFTLRVERLPGYLLWLAWEIVKSNVDVSRRILSPSLPIAPAVRWLPASQRSELARVIYADSITLTPGTLSIDLEDGSVEVHALNEGSLDALERGEMDARVSRLE
jgi:multicomponent Na+:H+ antiporter subunit E